MSVHRKSTIAEVLPLKVKKPENVKLHLMKTKTRYEKFCDNLIKERKALAKILAKNKAIIK